MKQIGVVIDYNGKYGAIKNQNNNVVDFSKKDISFNETLNVNDIVEYREEDKKVLKIARNIKKINTQI